MRRIEVQLASAPQHVLKFFAWQNVLRHVGEGGGKPNSKSHVHKRISESHLLGLYESAKSRRCVAEPRRTRERGQNRRARRHASIPFYKERGKRSRSLRTTSLRQDRADARCKTERLFGSFSRTYCSPKSTTQHVR